MSIYDNICTFSDVAQAKSLLETIKVKVHPSLEPMDVITDGEFNQSFVFPGRRMYIPGTTSVDADGNVIVITPDTDIPGYHIVISTVERSPEIEALPQCRVVINRDQLFYVHMANDINLTVMSKARLVPTIDAYPEGKLP